jgi:transcriptional regulator with XRE-family HTH domain
MRLAEWMDSNGVTDASLGERLGVDRTTISRIRCGRNKPSWDLAAKIKEASDGSVTPDDFLSEAQSDSS